MVWSEAEIERFVEEGFLILRDAFAREVAEEGREFIWQKMGLSPDAPADWSEPIIHIQEGFSCAPFDRVMNPRLEAGLSELMGPGRGVLHGYLGWWPVLFPGFEGPGGWHVDGHFQHHLTSREQGLVTLLLFSDIEPGDGGTAIWPGSHHTIARMLAEAEPDGLSPEALNANLPEVDLDQVVEVTGKAGDVAMLHPMLIHGFSANRGRRARFACNPQFPLKDALKIDRPDGAYSPVERAIRAALGRGSD